MISSELLASLEKDALDAQKRESGLALVPAADLLALIAAVREQQGSPATHKTYRIRVERTDGQSDVFNHTVAIAYANPVPAIVAGWLEERYPIGTIFTSIEVREV